MMQQKHSKQLSTTFLSKSQLYRPICLRSSRLTVFRSGKGLVKTLKSLAKEDRVQQALEKVYKKYDILVLHQTIRRVDVGNRILEEPLKLSVGTTSIIEVVLMYVWIQHLGSR